MTGWNMESLSYATPMTGCIMGSIHLSSLCRDNMNQPFMRTPTLVLTAALPAIYIACRRWSERIFHHGAEALKDCLSDQRIYSL